MCLQMIASIVSNGWLMHSGHWHLRLARWPLPRRGCHVCSLHHNAIGDAGCIKLAEALVFNSSLKKLKCEGVAGWQRAVKRTRVARCVAQRGPLVRWKVCS